jgi:hypothetical protein
VICVTGSIASKEANMSRGNAVMQQQYQRPVGNEESDMSSALSCLGADARFIASENEKNIQSTTSLVASTVTSKRTRFRNVKTITRNGRATPQSILEWYRILRVHYHWPLFQAIRFALWLSR